MSRDDYARGIFVWQLSPRGTSKTLRKSCSITVTIERQKTAQTFIDRTNGPSQRKISRLPLLSSHSLCFFKTDLIITPRLRWTISTTPPAPSLPSAEDGKLQSTPQGVSPPNIPGKRRPRKGAWLADERTLHMKKQSPFQKRREEKRRRIEMAARTEPHKSKGAGAEERQ